VNDYFFISSPLHFLMAANVAIRHPQHQRVAVLMSRDRTVAARYRAAAEKHTEIFNRVLDLSAAAARGRRGRAAAFRDLRAEFARPMTARLFTGNDRRLEFQYAMHIASRANPEVTGIYLDEGAVTYVGHKSRHGIAHRWLDPLGKKLYYGFWYRSAVTTGASAWIDAAHVAFPEAVHPLLRGKPLVAIDAAPFKTPRFQALATTLLAENAHDGARLPGLRLVLTLPHEGAYIRRPAFYAEIGRRLREHYDPASMALKPHPRITNHHVLAHMFPGVTLLDNRIGMEMLLPLLNDECLVVGDVSSTLLTTRWLRPDLRVLAIAPDGAAPTALAALYRRLRIPMVAVDQLADALASPATSGLDGPP
jgi:hypothetical protein